MKTKISQKRYEDMKSIQLNFFLNNQFISLTMHRLFYYRVEGFSKIDNAITNYLDHVLYL